MASRRPTMKVTIDEQTVPAFEGDTVLDVAKRAGIEIPTLCYVEGLSIWGGCRLCVVEIADDRRLQPACATAVADEMEIRTQSENLVEHRRSIVALLLAEGNHICSVCVSNGACELQDAAADLGVDHVEYDYQWPARTIDASHPDFTFDPNRCILCTRCVRTCAEVEGAYVWEIASRGSTSFLVAEMDRPWGESVSCTSCGKCVAVCPTGALLHTGTAVGEMRHDPGVVDFLTTARREQQWVDRSGAGS
jgi:bidirectional [NiFe] hydrogenase diaphorase subunit